MPVVPINKNAPKPQPVMRPLDPTFLHMAAAQMHDEGRLIKGSKPKIKPGVKQGG